MRVRTGYFMGFLALCFLAAGCTPATFVRQAPGWKSIELRDGLQYDTAWGAVVDVVSQDYDIEVLSKDSGYLRTGWKSGISGGDTQRYKGRLTVKFPPEHNQVRVKTEAQWFNPQTGQMIEGFDSLMNRDVYTAIGGVLGRTVPE